MIEQEGDSTGSVLAPPAVLLPGWGQPESDAGWRYKRPMRGTDVWDLAKLWGMIKAGYGRAYVVVYQNTCLKALISCV